MALDSWLNPERWSEIIVAPTGHALLTLGQPLGWKSTVTAAWGASCTCNRAAESSWRPRLPPRLISASEPARAQAPTVDGRNLAPLHPRRIVAHPACAIRHLTTPAPLRPHDSMLEKDEVVQDFRTLDPPFLKWPETTNFNVKVGVREGRILHMHCVNVCLRWCKISSVNRKGNASIRGT